MAAPTATRVDFPGWKSQDCKEILQLAQPLDTTRKRLSEVLPDVQDSPIVEDDADDGLGPYRGFHIDDKRVGTIAFVSYLKSAVKGTDVIVDADAPVDSAIERLQTLLRLRVDDIQWAHPTSNLGKILEGRKP